MMSRRYLVARASCPRESSRRLMNHCSTHVSRVFLASRRKTASQHAQILNNHRQHQPLANLLISFSSKSTLLLSQRLSMHTTDLSAWKHSHDFTDDTSSAEKRTHKVIALTAFMMIVEIAAGTLYHSMALLADGWHMSTHVAAFVLTALAYAISRRNAKNPQFTFGTGKIGVLGGFTSAIILSGIAVLMAIESVHRLITPVPIHFRQAIVIAVIGLA